LTASRQLLAVGVAVMGTMLWIAGTLWAALLVYNFITALFGINTFRVKYIELLRWLYRSVGMKPMKPTPKNGSMQRQYGDGKDSCIYMCACEL
jgi:hypothetical protein